MQEAAECRSFASCSRKKGSEQEFDGSPISRGFPESDEFGLGDGHTLSLEEEVAQVLIPSSAPQQGLDVAVDGLHHSETNLDAAVVENPVHMVDQHVAQFLESW